MEQKIGPNEFKCSSCDGIFEKGWTDEEALAEMQKNFGAVEVAKDLLCDDCYNKFMSETFN